MKKSLKLIITLIIGIFIGITCFSYAISYNSEEITYDNSTSGSTKTNVKDAVDELYSYTSRIRIINNGKRCIRAINLHTTTCQSVTGDGCQQAGLVIGEKITYGNLGTTGLLTAGDAFDCDVNDDGIYDGEKERFYYITDLEGDNTKAVLLYYSNTSEGVATPTKRIAYNSNNVNNQGPVTAVSDLPSTSQWKTTIFSNPRQITNENGGTTTEDGTIVSYNYDGLAARLITMQELRIACGRTNNMNSIGSLDTCLYTMENTKYVDSSLAYGYWLETPASKYSKLVWGIASTDRYITNGNNASQKTNNGARPAIEVPKTDIAY